VRGATTWVCEEAPALVVNAVAVGPPGTTLVSSTVIAAAGCFLTHNSWLVGPAKSSLPWWSPGLLPFFAAAIEAAPPWDEEEVTGPWSKRISLSASESPDCCWIGSPVWAPGAGGLWVCPLTAASAATESPPATCDPPNFGLDFPCLFLLEWRCNKRKHTHTSSEPTKRYQPSPQTLAGV